MAFYLGDTNGDQKLSFDEFLGVVPKDMMESYEMSQIEKLFNSVDRDGSGYITLDEFFVWTLSFVQQNTGNGLDAFFRKYDANNEGSLDAREFALAAEDLGFGPVAHEIFLELDPDESGAVSYSELITYLKGDGPESLCPSSISSQAKRFLTGVAFSASDVGDCDPSTWNLTSHTIEGLREELKNIMVVYPSVRVPNLYSLMTLEGTETVSEDNFKRALQRIGYKGEPEPNFYRLLFRALDEDGSGFFSVNDLHMWINGLTGRREKARKLTLLRKPVEDYHLTPLGTNAVPYPCPLNEVEWTSDALRKALQLMLITSGIAPLDMLRAWDNDDSGSFSKQEFLRMLKRIVHDNDLWDEEMREVCTQTYKEVSGGDSRIDVIEFEVWLNMGWLKLKREIKGIVPAAGAPACSHDGISRRGSSLFGDSFDAQSEISTGTSVVRMKPKSTRPPRPMSATTSLASFSSTLASSFYDLGASRGYTGSVYAEPPRPWQKSEKTRARRPSSGRARVMLLPPPPPELCHSFSLGELGHAHRRSFGELSYANRRTKVPLPPRAMKPGRSGVMLRQHSSATPTATDIVDRMAAALLM